jgi:hypothetical protein
MAGKRPDPAGDPQRLDGVGEVQTSHGGGLQATDLGPTMAAVAGVVGDGLLLQRAILGEVPHADEVVALAAAALAAGRDGRTAAAPAR